MRAAILSALGLIVAAAPAGAQWRVAAFAGNARTARADIAVAAPPHTAVGLDGVPFDDESSRSPIYYGLRVGRHFARAPWFGIEGEFMHAKAITRATDVVRVHGRFDGVAIDADLPVGTVLPRFELSHGLNFVLANAVVRLGLGADRGPDARVAVTARAGAGATVPHVEATAEGARADEYRVGRIGWQVAGGIDVRLWSGVSALTEVKWTGTNQQLDVGAASITVPIRTVHVVAGAGWRF
jgi:hypothetical protein